MNFDILRKRYINSIKPIIFNNFENYIKVCAPLRINFSAGWNDTPPYCNENTGYTINIPILYNNDFPIFVEIKKINDPKIILDNSNSQLEILNIYELLNCNSPYTPFALHKSAILASGLIPINTKFDLHAFLKKFGGFKLTTNVKNIPIGSRFRH